MTDIIQALHKKIDIAAKYLWFYNKPDAELTITGGELSNFLKHTCMETQLNIVSKTKGVLYDPALPSLLRAYEITNKSNSKRLEFGFVTGEKNDFVQIHKNAKRLRNLRLMFMHRKIMEIVVSAVA